MKIVETAKGFVIRRWSWFYFSFIYYDIDGYWWGGNKGYSNYITRFRTRSDAERYLTDAKLGI